MFGTPSTSACKFSPGTMSAADADAGSDLPPADRVALSSQFDSDKYFS